MKGKLTDHPLAELIREISTKGLSGALRLDHDQARTAIYFEQGALVFAASNIRDLRLRQYLSKNNLVSGKELSSFSKNGSDIALAKALSANGALTQTQAHGLLASLVADVLRVALLWTEGNWEFDERTHLSEDVRINIDIVALIREAAHRMPLKFVGSRFRNPGEMLSRAPQMANDQGFLPAESFVLSRLDAPTPLEELVAASGLQELDALRTIYGLALGGVIKRQSWKPAFRESVRAGTTADAKAIVPAPEEKTSRVSWTLDNQEEDLEHFLKRVENAANHYELMDLTPKAEADQIKEVYYTVARRYHPDRFHFKSGTSLHSRLSSAFAKVTQAYQTLSDAASRSTYDAGLERQRQFAGSVPSKPPPTAPTEQEFDDDAARPDSGQAEYSFREGFGALQQGRISAALTHLAAAARMDPGDARYRAYYGRALAANQRTRRLAENEIRAAVEMEPSNVTFRIMLAELYFDLKFHKRAQTELNRALGLDPNNRGAILLQRKMDRSRSG